MSYSPLAPGRGTFAEASVVTSEGHHRCGGDAYECLVLAAPTSRTARGR